MRKKDMKRWNLAQQYEYNWWKNYSGDLEWYREFSHEIESYTCPYLTIKEDTTILEIGSGAAGALTFLNSKNKYAIDPLEDYYRGRKEFSQFRDKRVHYTSGRGEELPYQDSFFDLIIIDNVLDHCEKPLLVLDEMNRVLKPCGIIFFRQNIYTRWGWMIRKFMELFSIDKGHPHTFIMHYLQTFFKEQSWEVQIQEGTSYMHSWKNDMFSGSVKGLIKACLFVTRSRTLFILKKK